MIQRTVRSVRHASLVVALLALACVYLPWTWSTQLGDLGGDSAVYLLTARDFTPLAAPDPVAHAVAAESQFPPLFPALLAAAGAANDPALAHLATTLCLLLAFAACYFWLSSIGIEPHVALAAVVLFALAPGTLVLALQIKSESLYLALSLAGLAWLTRGRAWPATVAFAAGLLTRSAGVALLAALLVMFVRDRPRGALWMLLTAVLPAGLWALQKGGQESYGGTLQVFAQAPFAAIVRQLLLNATAIAQGFAQNLVPSPMLAWVLLPLLALAGYVFVRRLRALEPDAGYLAAYLAMIFAWPFPSEAQRLAWVAVPVLIGYAVLGGRELLSRRGGQWLVPATLALLIAPSLVTIVQRRTDAEIRREPALAHLPEWYGADPFAAQARAQAHLEMARALESLGPEIPAGECVLSIKPATVAFYTHRDGFVPPFEFVDDAKFAAWLGTRKCRYFLLLDAAEPPQFRSAYYPRERLGERLEVVSVRVSDSDPHHHVVAALAQLKP